MEPEIILRDNPLSLGALLALALDDQIEVLMILGNLLYDPSVDHQHKLELDYFPFTGSGLRQYLDDKYMIAYFPSRSGSIEVVRIALIRPLLS